MNFKRLNDLIGWLVFAIATLVYFLTLEPTASWWDCGEYISTAYKLQVGHPPGAPLFQMIGRFFSLFAFGDTSKVALMINVMSALSSSLTILFLFWTITLLARKFMMQGEDANNKAHQYAVLGAGVVGALAYTFTESFWFSAVEGEVYAMSSFFTAVVFWAILRWEQVADEPHNYRWLLLIAYLIGLSIGVHLLNLLAVPAIVYVFYFKKYKPHWKGFVIAGLSSILILGFIMSFLIPQIVNLASKFELFFVNDLGLPFNFGTVVYFLLIFAAIVFGLYYTRAKGKVILNTLVLALMFIIIGYSSFFLIVIRANANTPINENEPNDAISLLSYLNREQYGDWPLLYGPYYNAPVVDYEDGSPVYIKDKKSGKYIITDNRKSSKAIYDPRFSSVFPRMWSNQKASHAKMYKQIGNIKGTSLQVTKSDGSTDVLVRPTFGENLRFFFNYQLGHMYVRYFMWNFVGRQNDVESQGEYENGNWVSGIGFIDNPRLGNQSNLPESMKSPAHTRYYFLPLLLGLAGLFFHLKNHSKDTWVVFLLFFMTGFAIVIYLNQTPLQPRERDYAYAGSFYAFAIWIGFGVLALYDALQKYLSKKEVVAIGVSLLSLVFVPGLMAVQGWEGHNRSGRYSARDFAKSYLAQCDPNAIVFTNGDNDTFPLWYVQEVENFRTDMRVVNYMLASGDWYVHQLGKKVYDSDPLPLTLRPEQYNKGVNEYLPVVARVNSAVELKDAINFVALDNDQTKFPLNSGEKINFLPAKKLKITVDKQAVIRSGIVPKELEDQIVDVIEWDISQGMLYKNDLMLLDLIASNNWQRPIYFVNPSAISKVFNVDKYCHMEGIVFKFMPVLAKGYYRGMGGVYAKGSYDLLVNKAKWGNLDRPKVTVDRESFRNSAIVKQSYVRLAQELVNEGKMDSAVIVLDKAQEMFPHSKIPYDYFMLPWVDLYFEAGARDKALRVMDILGKRYLDDLYYYTSLDQKFMAYYSNGIEEGLAVVNRLGTTGKNYGMPEFKQRMDEALNANPFLKEISQQKSLWE
ncbi:DUF2723 domain-containing protein [Bacteroidales bacterium]